MDEFSDTSFPRIRMQQRIRIYNKLTDDEDDYADGIIFQRRSKYRFVILFDDDTIRPVCLKDRTKWCWVDKPPIPPQNASSSVTEQVPPTKSSSIATPLHSEAKRFCSNRSSISLPDPPPERTKNSCPEKSNQSEPHGMNCENDGALGDHEPRQDLDLSTEPPTENFEQGPMPSKLPMSPDTSQGYKDFEMCPISMPPRKRQDNRTDLTNSDAMSPDLQTDDIVASLPPRKRIENGAKSTRRQATQDKQSNKGNPPKPADKRELHPQKFKKSAPEEETQPAVQMKTRKRTRAAASSSVGAGSSLQTIDSVDLLNGTSQCEHGSQRTLLNASNSEEQNDQPGHALSPHQVPDSYGEIVRVPEDTKHTSSFEEIDSQGLFSCCTATPLRECESDEKDLKASNSDGKSSQPLLKPTSEQMEPEYFKKKLEDFVDDLAMEKTQSLVNHIAARGDVFECFPSETFETVGSRSQTNQRTVLDALIERKTKEAIRFANLFETHDEEVPDSAALFLQHMLGSGAQLLNEIEILEIDGNVRAKRDTSLGVPNSSDNQSG